MSGRWWTAVGGAPTLDAVEKQLLTPVGTPSTDLSQAFLAWHRIGSRMIGTVARAPLPDVRAIDTAVLAVSEDAFDGLLTTVSKSLTMTYASLLVRDTIAESAAGARDTFRYLVDNNVSPPIAMERTALVFGVPFRRLSGYLQTAKVPTANPRVVDHEADMAVMEAARAFADAEAASLVAKDAAFESQVQRDDHGRFAPEGDGGEQAAAERLERRTRFARLRRRRGVPTGQPQQEAATPEPKAKQSQYLQRDLLGLGGLAGRTQARVDAEHAKGAQVRAERAARREARRSSTPQQARSHRALDRQQPYNHGEHRVSDDLFSADLDAEQRLAVLEALETGGTVSLADMSLSGGNATKSYRRSGYSLNEVNSQPSDAAEVRSTVETIHDDLAHYMSSQRGLNDVEPLSQVSRADLAWANLEDDSMTGMLHVIEAVPRGSDRHSLVRTTSVDQSDMHRMTGFAVSPDSVDDVVVLWTPGSLVADNADTRHGDNVSALTNVAYSVDHANTSYVLDATTGKTTLLVYLDPSTEVRKDYVFQESDVVRDDAGRFAPEGQQAAAAVGGSPRLERRRAMRRRGYRSAPQPAKQVTPSVAAQQYTLASIDAAFQLYGVTQSQRQQVHARRRVQRQAARNSTSQPRRQPTPIAMTADRMVDHAHELKMGIDRDFKVVVGLDRERIDQLGTSKGGSQFRFSPAGAAFVSGAEDTEFENFRQVSGGVLDTRHMDPDGDLPGLARIVQVVHNQTANDMYSGMDEVEFAVHMETGMEYSHDPDDLLDPTEDQLRAVEAMQEKELLASADTRAAVEQGEATGKPFRVVTRGGRPQAVHTTDAVFAFERPPVGVDLADALFEWDAPYSQIALTGTASADLSGLAATYQPEYWIARYVGPANRGG